MASESPLQLLQVLRKNPTLLWLVTILYVSMGAGYFVYYMARQRSAESERENARLRDELVEINASQRALAARSSAPTIDIFKRLSFNEKSTPRDQDKLRVAQSLNSFAKYALDNRDYRKATETLDESLKTFPTLEAEYYSGVAYYLEGNNDQALAFWKQLETSSGVPDDIYVYLSLAEYRSGNTQAAKKYADLYSRRDF